MKRRTRAVTLALVCLFFTGKTSAQAAPAEASGSVGGGIFLPTGADRDIVGNSPVLQLTASVGFLRRLGVEAGLLYTRLFLKEDALPAFSRSSASQITALGGIRVSTGRLIGNSRPLVGYLSLRAGAAREKVRATFLQIPPTSQAQPGAWVGRSVDALQNPTFGSGLQSSDLHWGFALSPKAGLFIRLSSRAALDLAFQPVFIFHQRQTTTQSFLTLGILLSSWQTF